MICSTEDTALIWDAYKTLDAQRALERNKNIILPYMPNTLFILFHITQNSSSHFFSEWYIIISNSQYE